MLNRVVLVGRLTRDPELRKTNSGNSVASFTVAVDNWQKDAEGNKTASFIPCTVFNQSAENVSKYARKGSLVGVDGRLTQRTFTRKDGTKGSTFEIICDSVQFLEPKSSQTGVNSDNNDTLNLSQESPVDDSKNLESIDFPDEDLPF